MKTLRILAIDDHEMITTGYKFLLEAAEFEEFTVKVETANTYEIGKQKIEDSARSFKYDLLLLDIQLTETHLEEPYTGEDLGILARKVVPDTKVVFMSSFSDNYR
ncbi:MAG: histidine kinase, partial [Arenibacter latericius]|nr:histidine kinase [Arenibacter latericius]